MDINKANEIGIVVNQINKYKAFLGMLDGHSYPDEYVIYYRGVETCELEIEALQLLIDFYKDKLQKAENKLKNM